LNSIGQSRGIIHKEGIVAELVCDENEYLTALKTNKELIECDFVFDCTGFKRLIIGNFYKSPWKSHSTYLPAKKAIPFFLEMDEQIPPYTEAIAMKYGWMWKIPLQHRYGCGYVFDSDYISDEEAIEEIESYLGYEPTYPRKDKGAFNFSAGCFEKIWIKNVLAVGLSSGFIEPLEATSIMQSIIVLRRFMAEKSNLESRNEIIKNRFNTLFVNDTQEVVEFLYLHYVTNKDNSNFWQDFTTKNLMPEKIKYVLEIAGTKPLTWHFDFPGAAVFESQPYNYVLIGNDLLNKQDRLAVAQKVATEERKKEYEELLNKQNEIIPQFMRHRDFIGLITGS
jgi:tryptophan halogenase